MKHYLDINIRTGHLHIYPCPKSIWNEHLGDFSKQIICVSLPILCALQRISNPDSAHINPFSHLRAPNLLLASSISNFYIGIPSNRLFVVTYYAIFLNKHTIVYGELSIRLIAIFYRDL